MEVPPNRSMNAVVLASGNLAHIPHVIITNIMKTDNFPGTSL